MISTCLISSISKTMSSLIDSFSASPVLAELGVEVEVDAAVVLALALGQDLVAGELVERGQDVLQPQDRAEQRDELLLRLPRRRSAARAGTASSSSVTFSAYSA